MKEVSLRGSSPIEIRFFLRPSTHPYQEILVVRYLGTYGYGSAGNADAVYMRAMTVAAVDAFEPDAIVHDFTGLRYEWGDLIVSVLDAGDRPHAMLVGPHCEEALRTLRYGVHGTERLQEAEGWFHDLEAACAYVDAPRP